MFVVQVALPVPLSRTFDYRLDSAMACPVVGARVSVPFGKRKAIGIVVGIGDTSAFPLEQLKTVDAVLDSDSLFPPVCGAYSVGRPSIIITPLVKSCFMPYPSCCAKGNRHNPPLCGNGSLLNLGEPLRRKV